MSPPCPLQVRNKPPILHSGPQKTAVQRPTRARTSPCLRRGGTTCTPHTQFANKQTSSTTPGPNVRFLVSWTVKQDRACSTPILRGQARSSDLGLQRKKDGAALGQDPASDYNDVTRRHPTHTQHTFHCPHTLRTAKQEQSKKGGWRNLLRSCRAALDSVLRSKKNDSHSEHRK